jgi:asparagine synthase (glutamine-hydrolysing)
MDQPSVDGINTYFVAKAAAESGLKVALSGIGGDELFAGYPSYRHIPVWVGAGVLLRALAGLMPRARGFLPPKIAGLLKYGRDFPGAYFVQRAVFMPWELEHVMGKEAAEEGFGRLGLFESLRADLDPDPGSPVARIAALESSSYLRNQLLRDADWAGMAHSLEIRTPLVDAGLLQALAPLVASPLNRAGKTVLKTEFRGVIPQRLLSRPKTGFSLPMAEWLAEEGVRERWRGMPLLRSRECHWSRRWSYAVHGLYRESANAT